MENDLIRRHGVSAWLANMGYSKLADVVMDEDRFPSAQPETHDKRTESHACDLIDRQPSYSCSHENDTISRTAAVDATWFEPSYTDPLNVLTEVRDRLKVLPSAQPKSYREGYQAGYKDAQSERKRGRWERVYPLRSKSYLRFCSVCREQCWYCGTGDYNYCPNCGADMREVDDERPD